MCHLQCGIYTTLVRTCGVILYSPCVERDSAGVVVVAGCPLVRIIEIFRHHQQHNQQPQAAGF